MAQPNQIPPPNPQPNPIPGVAKTNGSMTLSTPVIILLSTLVLNIIFIAIFSIIQTTDENLVNGDIYRLVIEISSMALLIAGVFAILISNRNLNSLWGLIGYTMVCLSTIPMSVYLSTLSSNSSGFSGGFTSVIGVFVLAITLMGIYYGSTGSDGMKTAVFYGSIVMLILYALFYSVVFGNPVGISSRVNFDNLNKLNSDKYTLIYKSSARRSGVFKRTLFDQVYLSVAYPTLGINEYPPIHNSNAIQGSHSLTNYERHLKMGASAFLFDIFYESNPSSPNVNTWRVGTLNTQSGTVQNKRTISLDSVLYSTNQAVTKAVRDGRLIYLFLNPRYTTAQEDLIPQLEDKLAEIIKQNVTHLTLPSLNVSMPQSSSMNSRLEDQLLDNARQQVVLFLGGTRPVSLLSSRLKNVVHGVTNFTDCYVSTEGAQPYNAIAYNPKQTTTRVNLGLGSFSASNESRLTELVPLNASTSVQTSFLATIPDSNTDTIAYKNDTPVYITHSACFPFVYPYMLTESAYSSDVNKKFYQGFAPVAVPKGIVSMVFSNKDGDDQPARQRMAEDKRCDERYNNQRVLNPAKDDEWSLLIQASDNSLKSNNWCNNYKNNNKGLPVTIVESDSVFPLILYSPSDGHYSGGMIPKPTLVQTESGQVFQLRNVINQVQVQASSIEQ